MQKSWKIFRQDKLGIVGTAIVVIFVVLAISAGFFPDPVSQDNWYLAKPFANPKWVSLFGENAPQGESFGLMGTDELGRDLFAQLLYGSRISLFVGFLAAAVSLSVGLPLGLLSGYFGGKVDRAVVGAVDLMLTLPVLPLIIILASTYGANIINVVIIIGLIYWTYGARIIRSQVLTLKERAYIEAARSIGATDLYIIRRHLFPNVVPLLFANLTAMVGFSILAESSLSFIGLGDPTLISWGNMMYRALNFGAFTQLAMWYIIPPGFCLGLLVVGVYFVGNAIETVLTPIRQRR